MLPILSFRTQKSIFVILFQKWLNKPKTPNYPDTHISFEYSSYLAIWKRSPCAPLSFLSCYQRRLMAKASPFGFFFCCLNGTIWNCISKNGLLAVANAKIALNSVPVRHGRLPCHHVSLICAKGDRRGLVRNTLGSLPHAASTRFQWGKQKEIPLTS